jgi:hypothetical protein
MESEEYKGLISPDAYEYLDLTPEEELLHDPYLDEQEKLSDAYDGIDDDYFYDAQEEEAVYDDSEMYSYSSLFDEADEEASENIPVHEEEPEEAAASYTPFPDDLDPDEESSQTLPEPLATIVSLLPPCACSSYLSECDSDIRNSIVRAISTAISSCLRDGKDKMFTIPGTSISIAVIKPSEDPMIQSQRLQSIAAVMACHEAASWTGLFISADEKYNVTGAWVKEIKQDDFSPRQWRTIMINAERMKAGR